MFGMIYKNQKCLLNNLTWATGRAFILKHFYRVFAQHCLIDKL